MARPELGSHRDIANRVFCFLLAPAIVLKNWGFYLYEKEFDGEPELRNKLTAIWFSSLYDTLAAEVRDNGAYYQNLFEACERIGRPGLLRHCCLIPSLCGGIRQFMDDYSVKQQIFIQDFRNQLVHGWQANPFEEKVAVKYVWRSRFITKRISWACNTRVQRRMHQRGIDNVLTELFEPIWRQEHHFVRELLRVTQVSENLERLRKEIYEGVDPPMGAVASGS